MGQLHNLERGRQVEQHRTGGKSSNVGIPDHMPYTKYYFVGDLLVSDKAHHWICFFTVFCTLLKYLVLPSLSLSIVLL